METERTPERRPQRAPRQRAKKTRKRVVRGVAIAASGGTGAVVPKSAKGCLASVVAVLVMLVVIVATISSGLSVAGPPTMGGGQGENAAGLPGPGQPSAAALNEIPPEYLALYQAAGAAEGLDWAILAGIGSMECNHGRGNCGRGKVNECGARGPMQFLGNTWRSGTDRPKSGECPGPTYFTGNPVGPPIPKGQETGDLATDGNGDGVADPWEPVDAIFAAARYLRRSGAPQDYPKALWRYNNSDTYVKEVLRLAATYRAGGTPVGGYALPLPQKWFDEHLKWFTKPHHDYPAADIPVNANVPVFAAAAGTVMKAPVGGTCGYGVTIKGFDGWVYVYCHGPDDGPLVKPDQTVAAGQPIMVVGSTGRSDGPHLHFGIQTVDGVEYCPQSFLVAVGEHRVPDVKNLTREGCSY